MGQILKSVTLIQSGKIDFEFRTTLSGNYHTKPDITKIAGDISGVLYLQNFRQVEGVTPDYLFPFPGFEKLGNRKYRNTRIEVRK